MKPAFELAKENFRNLKPCIHGADVFEAASTSGFRHEDILDFSSSVNPLGASEKALKAVRRGFARIPSYPDSSCTALREAIACHYAEVKKDNIVVGNGSTELIYLFAAAFLRKGDVAVVPAPSFGEYETAVKRTGEKVKFLRFGRNFQTDPSRFEDALTGKVKIVYFCNPNNPTSILTSKTKLTEIIKKALGKDILVFLDEDFLEFVENEKKLSMISEIGKFPNLFVLRSFTKIFGLTGLRVGYGIASEEIVDILVNAKIPWNVNCLAQSAAVAALNDEEHIEKTMELIKEEKSFLLSELKSFYVFKVYPPDANFIFIDIRKSGLSSIQLKEQMLKRGVLIRDCSSFVGLNEHFIRVAIKTRFENEKLLAALKASVDRQV